MPKIKELIQPPPEPEGNGEQQIAALRDYLVKITQELYYLLTHLEADNINDSTFQKISGMIPRPYTGLPLTDGTASPGSSGQWARGDHRHGHDGTKADVTALEEAAAALEDALEHEADAREDHEADKANPHEVTKAQVGLGSVADERQYSALNPPPIPTPEQVGAISITEKGSVNGVAELDASGHVPSSQLPSYVDDVLEYPSAADFPAEGESGKIYVDLAANLTYRWGGSAYTEISPSLALGETGATAYRGDRGKTAYDHSQNPYTGTPEMDGAGSAGDSLAWARGNHQHPTDNSRAAASLEINGHPLTGDFDLDAADVGLGNVADERQYSAQNPPPYPVTSVNGATGDVTVAVPSASSDAPAMDGAASPGSSTFWARGDHVHPVDTSRAPAGYGLGVKLGTLTPIADADDTTLMTGWYATSATPTDTQNLPSGLSGDDKVGALYVAARGEYVYQEFYCNRRNRVYSRLRGWSGSGYAWTAWQVEASIDPANPFATEQQLAYVETGSTASRAYAVGEYFCWNGLLYRATAAISSGAAFTDGTNCVAQTVGAALTGKAPAGYGLGVMTRDIGTSVTDCNNIDVTGWFDVAAGASNRPSGLSQYYQAVIYSVVRGPIYSYQEYYDYNTGKVYRRFKNTTWSSWVQI